jgi:cation:H+ antiporter
MTSFLIFAGGLLLAGLGGELFVRSVLGLAGRTRIPAAIIATTLAAFATSAPELAVSVSAALDGRPQIGFGDAIGSNIVNIALILGLALIIAPISVRAESQRRDIPVALVAPVATALLLIDDRISRLDALAMLAIFVIWLGANLLEAQRRRRASNPADATGNLALILAFAATGLVSLAVSGQLIVLGARSIADALGVDGFIVGSTLVALGTSMPELATTMVAALRRRVEIGFGMLLGSNIFNGLLIVPAAALIHPIEVPWREAAVGLGFGLIVVLPLLPVQGAVMRRRRGALFLALYVLYVMALFEAARAG